MFKFKINVFPAFVLSLAIVFGCSYGGEDLDNLTYDPHHTFINVKINGEQVDFDFINAETREHGEISRLSVINKENTQYIELMWELKEDHKHFDFGAFPEVHYVYFEEGVKYEFIQSTENDMHNINLYHDDKMVLHFKGEVKLTPKNAAAKATQKEGLTIFLDLQKGYDG